jgi:hypothetical protein
MTKMFRVAQHDVRRHAMTSLRFILVSLATLEREQKGEVLCGRAARAPTKICFSILFYFFSKISGKNQKFTAL